MALSSLLIHGIIISKEYSKRSRTYECRYPNVNCNLSIIELFRFLRNLPGNPLMLYVLIFHWLLKELTCSLTNVTLRAVKVLM